MPNRQCFSFISSKFPSFSTTSSRIRQRSQPVSIKVENRTPLQEISINIHFPLLLIWFDMEFALFPSFFLAILLPGQFDVLWPSCSHLAKCEGSPHLKPFFGMLFNHIRFFVFIGITRFSCIKQLRATTANFLIYLYLLLQFLQSPGISCFCWLSSQVSLR